jgi:hypothetical protein
VTAVVRAGARLNSEALYLALDQKRRREGLSWRDVVTVIGLAPAYPLGTHLGQGGGLAADTFLRLLLWLGETDIRPYVGEAVPDA